MSSPLPSSTVSIREYRGDVDMPGLVAFIAMQFEHESAFQEIARKHGGRIAPQYAEELVRTIQGRSGCLFIADIGSNPVGFIAAYRLSDPDPVLEESSREHGFVRDLFVLPNWRRMKVASRLLQAAEDHFRQLGISRLRMAGVAQNEAMNKLCKAIGYQPFAIVYDRRIPMPQYSIVGDKIVKGAG